MPLLCFLTGAVAGAALTMDRRRRRRRRRSAVDDDAPVSRGGGDAQTVRVGIEVRDQASFLPTSRPFSNAPRSSK